MGRDTVPLRFQGYRCKSGILPEGHLKLRLQSLKLSLTPENKPLQPLDGILFFKMSA